MVLNAPILKVLMNMANHTLHTIGPGSLPGYRRRAGLGIHGECDDGASDISSTSGFSAFGYRSGKQFERVIYVSGRCIHSGKYQH